MGGGGGPAPPPPPPRPRPPPPPPHDTPSKPKPPKPPKPPTKVVDLSRLVAAARRDPAKTGTPISYAGARIVEDALAAEGLLTKKYVDGHFGTSTVAAYRKWQRRCGYSGAAADGIPGRNSLAALGRAHGFTVTT
ncbi:peptidoglycan-binding protein [Streptomyces spectabilis]|uniref:peptidoglycan-binding protein n=1 Tax=Streptomyces spectabilis TaxID=68270 RepID=UPI0033E683CA